MKNSFPFALLFMALTAHCYANTPESTAPSPANDTWVDKQHSNVRKHINQWAYHIDDWFGTPDPDQPASANLRLMLDTHWNKYDQFTVKPRVRGRIKLPVLQKKFNLIIGDDSIDDELRQTSTLYTEATTQPTQKTFDRKESRDDNASLALRWSDMAKRSKIDTDVDIGVRSGDDIYLRLKASKDWQLQPQVKTRLEQIYRYGIDSKHYARTNWETTYHLNDNNFFANQLHISYTKDKEDNWSWGNSLYREHHFPHHKRLNYGIYAGGDITQHRAKLNHYGPFIGWRQPTGRDWLFIQTEVNYLNNRSEKRSHHVGTFMRLEALF